MEFGGERAGKDHRIFDRHRRAHPQERQHRVRRIAQQRGASGTPPRQRRAVEQTPFDRRVDLTDQAKNVRMPSRKTRMRSSSRVAGVDQPSPVHSSVAAMPTQLSSVPERSV